MASQCYTASLASARSFDPEPHFAQRFSAFITVSFHPSMGREKLPHPRNMATCILPGLFWQGEATTLLSTTRFPGLAAILESANITWQSGERFLPWLARQFGRETLPWGYLRLRGERSAGFSDRDFRNTILCADPVSLLFTRDALLLHGPSELALHADETDALIATLNTEFGNVGQFFAADPSRWYFQTNEPCATFSPLEDVVGRPAAYFAPTGAYAPEWARFSNEIQILLHAHPINQLRTEKAQAIANALWFWGDGSNVDGALSSPVGHIISSDPLIGGLAAAASIPHHEPAQVGMADHGFSGTVWWHDSSLYEASLYGDHDAWIRALERLDTQLFQPLWHALGRSSLHRLVLLAPSGKTNLTVTASRYGHWKFWRKHINDAHLTAILHPSHLASNHLHTS